MTHDIISSIGISSIKFLAKMYSLILIRNKNVKIRSKFHRIALVTANDYELSQHGIAANESQLIILILRLLWSHICYPIKEWTERNKIEEDSRAMRHFLLVHFISSQFDPFLVIVFSLF